MTIDQLIDQLQEKRATHGGETEITTWSYAGGLDDLCDVYLATNPVAGTIVIEPSRSHESGAQR